MSISYDGYRPTPEIQGTEYVALKLPLVMGGSADKAAVVLGCHKLNTPE